MLSNAKIKKRPTRLLSSSRPTLPAKNHKTTLSSKATRTLIRSHHNLHKQLKQAEIANDEISATKIRAQIDAQGGLAKYQEASIQGQSAQRGGDSSKVLVEWIRELAPDLSKYRKLRLLEVGALKTDNACSTCGIFDVEGIDLNSQSAGILEQDFMQRPIPANETERQELGFDVVSLSLVVNYVPDAMGRGEMLRRVASFLRVPAEVGEKSILPGLFLVLPSPCVMNSRYLDENRLEEIIENLGYKVVKKKISSKLVYYYLHLFGAEVKSRSFPKKELRAGGKRNNFAIVL